MTSIICLSFVICFVTTNLNNQVKKETISILDVDKGGVKASFIKKENLTELKNESDLIVIAKSKKLNESRDYKGIQVNIFDMGVLKTYKGDIDIKEFKILLNDKLEKSLQANDEVLLYLKKGIDNADCYVPVGSSYQGMFSVDKKNHLTKKYFKSYEDDNLNSKIVEEVNEEIVK